MDKETVVIYHNDLDGFGAAYALWTQFDDSASYHSWSYTKPVDYDLIQNKHVIMVDFSFDLPTTKQINYLASSLAIVDHHASAEKELGHLDYFNYFPSMSGATATWITYVSPNPPELLKYIEDRDLWRNQLPNCREVIYALDSYPYRFWTFDNIIKEGQKGIDRLTLEGTAIKRHIDRQLDLLTRNSTTKIKINDDVVYAINSPIYQSEIGNILAKQGKFGVAYFDQDGCTNYSLRSVGNMDVSEVAKKFGGGGHKAASGFSCARRMHKIFSADVVEDNMEEMFREIDESTLMKYREGRTKHGPLDIKNDPRDFIGEETLQEGEDLINYLKIGLIKLRMLKEKTRKLEE